MTTAIGIDVLVKVEVMLRVRILLETGLRLRIEVIYLEGK